MTENQLFNAARAIESLCEPGSCSPFDLTAEEVLERLTGLAWTERDSKQIQNFLETS